MPINPPEQDQLQRFIALLSNSLEQDAFSKLVLSKYRGNETDLVRIVVRQVMLRDQPQLCFVYSYKTRDITKNLSLPEGLATITGMLGGGFKNANLFTLNEELQLNFSKRGKAMLHRGKRAQSVAPSREHNTWSQHPAM